MQLVCLVCGGAILVGWMAHPIRSSRSRSSRSNWLREVPLSRGVVGWPVRIDQGGIFGLLILGLFTCLEAGLWISNSGLFSVS